MQLAIEPRLRERPVTLDRDRRDVQHPGDLLDGQPAEEPKLHELTLARVRLREPLQREIQRDDIHRQRLECRIAVLERDSIATAAFLRVMRSRVINKDAAHQVGGDREELGAVLPLDPPLIDEFQIGLVHQGRRRQRVIEPLPLEIAPRQPAQFPINGVEQDAPRGFIAFVPGDEKPRHVGPGFQHELLYAR